MYTAIRLSVRAPLQRAGEVLKGDLPLQQLPLLAHAIVYHPEWRDKDIEVLGNYRFVEPQLAPRLRVAGKGQ